VSDGQTSAQRTTDRGREAARPCEMPARGWKDVLWRCWQQVSDSNIFLVAGGVTYSVLLALFPGLAALVSIYGLLLNPEQIEQQTGALTGVLPDQSRQLLADELHQLASTSGGALGLGAIVGLLFALWSASRGMSGMITALGIAYRQKESRSFVRFNVVALILTIGVIIGGVVAITLIAGVPAVMQFIGLGGSARWLILALEWPLLVLVMMGGLAVLYRYGPDRAEAQWRWVSPGAVAATLLWALGSVLFTVYVTNFASYDKTYGSLGGAVVMLTWLYLSAFAVLLGAVINAETERQTRQDTTTGHPEPMGRRGAYAADTLGAGGDDNAEPERRRA
jgi:membrane protein